MSNVAGFNTDFMSLHAQCCNACNCAPGTDDDEIVRRLLVYGLADAPRSANVQSDHEFRRDFKRRKRAATAAVRQSYGVGIIAGFFLWWAIGKLAEAAFEWLWNKWNQPAGQSQICAAACSAGLIGSDDE